MPWNVSGLYERLYNWVADRDLAIAITASKMDAEQDGIVGAINDIVQQNEQFQGSILAVDGAIATPGYTFADDTDTGIYRSAANTAALVTNSTALLTWNASGVTIPTLAATTADIDGGTLDGVTIGGSSAAAATVTNLTASGTVSFSGATVSDAGTITTADINGGTVDGVTIGGAAAGAGTFTNLTATGTVTLTGATVADGGAVTTIDINGGTIDGAVIGGSSAAAIDGTTITASTGFSGPGTGISTLDASNLSTGTVPAARLSEASAANIRAGAANVLVTPANIESAVEEVTLTDAATIAVDWSSFINGIVTLGGNRTLGAPSNAEPGTTRIIRVVQSTGSHTLSFNAAYLFPGGAAPTMSAGAGDKDTLYIYCETTSLFHVTHQLDFS